MKPFKVTLLSNTVLPLMVSLGVAISSSNSTGASASEEKIQLAANPCAAKNPCAANPCAAAAAGASSCTIPRLVQAALKNPCAANPCAAGPAEVELTKAELTAAYKCLINDIRTALEKSGYGAVQGYMGWKNYSTAPYQSATHGMRYVNNYANTTARNYDLFENLGKLPAGSVLVKDSLMVQPNGSVSGRPIVIMEKMQSGFFKESADWHYAMIMPNGSILDQIKGRGSGDVAFCIECHAAAADSDSLFFLPEEYRAASN